MLADLCQHNNLCMYVDYSVFACLSLNVHVYAITISSHVSLEMFFKQILSSL